MLNFLDRFRIGKGENGDGFWIRVIVADRFVLSKGSGTEALAFWIMGWGFDSDVPLFRPLVKFGIQKRRDDMALTWMAVLGFYVAVQMKFRSR